MRKYKTAFATLALLALVAAAGTAMARWPKLGEEWAEWTRYDAAGNAIGGGRIECDGSIRTWGDSGSPGGGLTLYPCY